MTVADAQVAVVGGGAAGLVAALAAARSGARVAVLERMPRVGRKILATGNGRCNLTNLNLDPSRFHGQHPDFPRPALSLFPASAARDFFEELGLATVVEEGDQVFPRCGQASAVLDLLRHELERLGVAMSVEAEVHRIRPRGGGFLLEYGRGNRLGSERVVLAPGGRAAPHLGSNGSGHNLAAALGHRLTPLFPALTKLRCRAPFLTRLKGVKVAGAVSLSDGRAPLRTEAGEILFTETGLSGPPVLQLSRLAGELLREKRPVVAVLNLVTETGGSALEGLLKRRFAALRGPGGPELALVGFLNKRLIPVVLAEAGWTGGGPSGEVIRRLAGVLNAWPIPVAGLGSWTEAQVTAGGVDTSQVDPVTMESRLVPGLHLAGEVLDVDGDCGGFNLHWAWASGRLAGLAAAGARG